MGERGKKRIDLSAIERHGKLTPLQFVGVRIRFEDGRKVLETSVWSHTGEPWQRELVWREISEGIAGALRQCQHILEEYGLRDLAETEGEIQKINAFLAVAESVALRLGKWISLAERERYGIREDLQALADALAGVRDEFKLEALAKFEKAEPLTDCLGRVNPPAMKWVTEAGVRRLAVRIRDIGIIAATLAGREEVLRFLLVSRRRKLLPVLKDVNRGINGLLGQPQFSVEAQEKSAPVSRPFFLSQRVKQLLAVLEKAGDGLPPLGVEEHLTKARGEILAGNFADAKVALHEAQRVVNQLLGELKE